MRGFLEALLLVVAAVAAAAAEGEAAVGEGPLGAAGLQGSLPDQGSPVAARASIALPAAAAAFDAMPAEAQEAAASRLSLTPAALRSLVTTSAAVTFEARDGVAHYRCDFGGSGVGGGPLAFPFQTAGSLAPAGADQPAADAESLPGLLPASANVARGAAAVDPGSSDPAALQAFKLHSRPGASKTLYLDFDGHTTTGTYWNRAPCPAGWPLQYCYSATNNWAPSFKTPPFDIDSPAAPNTFSSLELEAIIAIWRNVAEDYTQFDLDVTTEAPTFSLAGGRGMRVCIGGSDLDWYALGTNNVSIAGGISYVGNFGDGWYGQSTYPASPAGNEIAPAYVFIKPLAGDPKNIWEAVSHEAGHSLGLLHHGREACAANNYNREEYYGGHSTSGGGPSWAPIMGSSYTRTATQWAKGEYAYASQPKQDDVATISKYAPLAADDAGDSRATATTLTGVASLGQDSFIGIIGAGFDADVFRFYSGPGLVSVTLLLNKPYVWKPFANSISRQYERTNLDATIVLNDWSGNVLKTWSNATGLLQGSLGQVTVPNAGVYFLTIQGRARATPTNGFSSYGSQGTYKLTVTGQQTAYNGTYVQCTVGASSTIQLGAAPGTSCDSVVLQTSDIYTASGVEVATSPPLPASMTFQAGSYSFQVYGSAGNPCMASFKAVSAASCTSKAPAPAPSSVVCPSRTKSFTLQEGSCDGMTLTRDDIFEGGDSVRVSPSLPANMVFGPGRTVYTMSSADGSKGCRVRVVIQPCVPKCNGTAPVLPTAPGKCSAARLPEPLPLLAAASIGSGVTSLKMGGGSFRLGERRVTVSAKYPGGVTAKASCPVTVVDTEAPGVQPNSGANLCGYPGRSGGEAACFGTRSIAKPTDNCKGATLKLQNCTVTANGNNSDCSLDSSGRVCLKFPDGASGLASRTAQVTFVAVDAAENTSPPAAVTITAYSAKPSERCKSR